MTDQVFDATERPKIHSRVMQDNRFFDAGQEQELFESSISGDDLQRLTDMGVISNFPAKDDTGLKTAELELPPIKQLAAFLAKIDDAEKVSAMSAADTRVSAQPLYAARLAELE